MKEVTNLIIRLIMILYTGYCQVQRKTTKNARSKFKEFNRKEKFIASATILITTTFVFIASANVSISPAIVFISTTFVFIASAFILIASAKKIIETSNRILTTLTARIYNKCSQTIVKSYFAIYVCCKL